MEPITCPHASCGRTWTPRKANPVKCPTCQNPLWRSPRPKKYTHRLTEDVPSDKFVVSMEATPANAIVELLDETECVRAPEEKDSLSSMRNRAEELLRQMA